MAWFSKKNKQEETPATPPVTPPATPSVDLPPLPTPEQPQASDDQIARELLAAAGLAAPQPVVQPTNMPGVQLPAFSLDRLEQMIARQEWNMNRNAGQEFFYGLFGGYHVALSAEFPGLFFMTARGDELARPHSDAERALQVAREWNATTNLGTMTVNLDNEDIVPRIDICIPVAAGLSDEQFDYLANIGVSCLVQGLEWWKDKF